MHDTRLMDRKDLIERVEHLEFCLREITKPAETLETPHLRKKHARLLGALMSAKGRIVTRDALMAAIYWDRPERDWPLVKIIDVYVWDLRRVLRDEGSNLAVESVWGRGYRVVKA